MQTKIESNFGDELDQRIITQVKNQGRESEVYYCMDLDELILVHFNKPTMIHLDDDVVALDQCPFVYETNGRFDFQQCEEPKLDNDLILIGGF